MDPVTHAIIGLSISKSIETSQGIFNAATIAVTLGSMFPDIDIVFRKWGDYIYYKNHRGITHSLVGILIGSILIAFVIKIFTITSISTLFYYALIGCISHIGFDTLNSCGAKIFWPFTNRKYYCNFFAIFDPIMMTILIGYILSYKVVYQYICLIVCIIYIILRIIMRFKTYLQLKSMFNEFCKKINLIPSMTGLFKWQFILETEDLNIIGEKDILRNKMKILTKLNKINIDEIEKVKLSVVGKFFSDFTPLFHIAIEKDENVSRYVFTDMRYCVRDRFIHHAILELDENDCVIRASFNPYNIERSSLLPVGEYNSRNERIC